MNARTRKTLKANSNNSLNNNQNICTQAVCQWAGVDHLVRYLHTHEDVKRALRKKYSVRSIKSALGKAKTVGAARKVIAQMFADRCDLAAIYIYVPGHVILVDRNGNTIVDTAPRIRDRRRVVYAYGLYRPRGL